LDASHEETYVMDETELKHLSDSMEGQIEGKSSVSNWKLLEKDLCLKGIEMFGRNRYKSILFSTSHFKTILSILSYMQFMICSCLISQNLLFMMKTCKEVASYMYAEVPMPHGSMNENENVRYY